MEDFIAELQELSGKAPPFKPRPLKNPNNRWLVRSAFQKAIRRGQHDNALRMGEYLIAPETQAYPWQSLATVIVEDVGYGDLNLLAYSTMTTLKGVRDQVEEVMLFAAMIQSACSAPKTRSCCELELGANIRSERPGTEEHSAWAGFMMAAENGVIDEGALRAQAIIKTKNSISELAVAYLAMKLLRKRLRGLGHDALAPSLNFIHHRLVKKVGWEEFAARAAMLAFERGQDTMHLALFPLLQWTADMQQIERNEEPEWPPSIRVGAVGSEAYDMHTMQGKKAIRAFWGVLKGKYEWAAQIDKDEATKAIGSLVFIMEGGMVDRRLVSAQMLALKDYQDMNFAVGYGLPSVLLPQFAQIKQDVWNEIPRLNDCRLWACK